MSVHARFALSVLAVLVAASVASAQTALPAAWRTTSVAGRTPDSRMGDRPAHPAAGPRLDSRAVGIRARAASRLGAASAVAVQPPALRQRGVPQMIIGGAALVGGAIIGDDVGAIVMLGGLGYGLYGLYLYLQ